MEFGTLEKPAKFGNFANNQRSLVLSSDQRSFGTFQQSAEVGTSRNQWSLVLSGDQWGFGTFNQSVVVLKERVSKRQFCPHKQLII